MRADHANGDPAGDGITGGPAARRQPPANGGPAPAERAFVAAAAVDGPPPVAEDETTVVGDPDRPWVTVPGRHTVMGGRRIQRGNDTFVNMVLGKLPPDLLYRSGNSVGVLTPDPVEGGLAFDAVGPADIDYLVDRHMMLRTWGRTAAGRPREKFVNCGSRLSRIIESRAKRHPTVRLLTRIVQYPIYGHDLARYPSGWSPDGTYFDCPPDLASLEPEADEAVIHDTLDLLLTDFPFREEADRQNFIGMLLTPILRPALDGNVPLHTVIAPMPRTGKSKLIEEVWGGVILGRPTPAQPMTGNDEEFEKRVVSMLIGGETMVHLDNLSASTDSPVLASLLTAGQFQGRELGRSKVLRLKNNLILAASVNNPRLTEELAKRAVPIQLQPLDEHPENRVGFTHPDIRAYVIEVRPLVLSCLLGMVERWKGGGGRFKPRVPGDKPMGGFEAWARVVGGVMKANGYDDWMGNADQWRKQVDPETDDVRALITEWAREHGKRPRPASDVVDVARGFGLFSGVLDKKKEAANLSAFSRAVLAKYLNRPFMGLRIVRVTSGNNTRYQLEGDDDAFRVVTNLPARERIAGHAGPQPEVPDFTD